ncbi:MAG TPA: DUF2393 family protein [Acidobacteriaceae bacterium]|nr:DUF2393 family protein [Acidobacteriaceae bacterium]
MNFHSCLRAPVAPVANRSRYNRRMHDPALKTTDPSNPFKSPTGDDRNLLPWVVAAVVVVVLLGFVFLLSGHTGRSAASTPRDAAYAGNIALSQLKMSQASNFAGSQLTYIDGVIVNKGSKTVTGIVVQALFANDSGEPPQAEQVPFTLIRTRDPYVDTQSVSAAPLAPGASREFRLIYDDISPMWNQQLPLLKVISVTTTK